MAEMGTTATATASKVGLLTKAGFLGAGIYFGGEAAATGLNKVFEAAGLGNQMAGNGLTPQAAALIAKTTNRAELHKLAGVTFDSALSSAAKARLAQLNHPTTASTSAVGNIFSPDFSTSSVSAKVQERSARDSAIVHNFLGNFLGSVNKVRAFYASKLTAEKAKIAKKLAADQAKAQRQYASAVAASGEQLKADTGAALGSGPSGVGLTHTQKSAFDSLIQFYKQESHDSKLTAIERARYKQDAANAIKAESAQSQKDALDYEKVTIDAAKARYDLVRRVKGDIDAKEAALRGEVRAYSTAAANKALSPTDRAA